MYKMYVTLIHAAGLIVHSRVTVQLIVIDFGISNDNAGVVEGQTDDPLVAEELLFNE